MLEKISTVLNPHSTEMPWIQQSQDLQHSTGKIETQCLENNSHSSQQSAEKSLLAATAQSIHRTGKQPELMFNGFK